MSRPARGVPVAAGILAGLALLVFYLAIVALAEGRAAVWPQLRQDLPSFAILVPAFGTQVGLYVHLRAVRAATRAATAMAGTNAGVSGATMVACCAHFLPTLLPIVGISALSAALAAWKAPLLWLAIAMNLGGVTLALRALRHAKAMPAGSALVRDPVCGMEIAAKDAAGSSEHGGKTYSFCSAACAAKFRSDPARWAVPAGPGKA